MRTTSLQKQSTEDIMKCPEDFGEAERVQWDKHLPRLGKCQEFAGQREMYIQYCKSFCKAVELDKVIRRKGLFLQVSDGSLWRRKEVMEAIRYWVISSNLASRLGVTTRSVNRL